MCSAVSMEKLFLMNEKLNVIMMQNKNVLYSKERKKNSKSLAKKEFTIHKILPG